MNVLSRQTASCCAAPIQEQDYRSASEAENLQQDAAHQRQSPESTELDIGIWESLIIKTAHGALHRIPPALRSAMFCYNMHVLSTDQRYSRLCLAIR